MDAKQMREIEARRRAIGDTPWEFTRNNGIRLLMSDRSPFDARIVNAPEGDVVYVPEFPWSPDQGNAIAEFVRAAPEDVEALLAEVRHLRRRIDTARVACQSCGKAGTLRPDPYQSEIHGDSTLVALCDGCAAEKTRDV